MFKIIGHAFLSVCGPWGLEPLQILRRRQLMAAWPAEPGIKGPGRTPQMSHIWFNHHETRLKSSHNVTVKSPILKKSVSKSHKFLWHLLGILRHLCSKCLEETNSLGLFSWDFRMAICCFLNVSIYLGFCGDLVVSTRPTRPGRAWKSQQLVDGTPGLFQKSIATKQTTCIEDQSTKRPSDQATKSSTIHQVNQINQSINQIKSSQNRINPI